MAAPCSIISQATLPAAIWTGSSHEEVTQFILVASWGLRMEFPRGGNPLSLTDISQLKSP